MACFLIPAGEAIVTTIIQKVVESKEKKGEVRGTSGVALKWSRKLSWLNKMLWGGSAVLALEHVLLGELVPWPPFLTALESPANVAPMLHEMATVGIAITVSITIAWSLMVLVSELKAKANRKAETNLAARVG